MSVDFVWTLSPSSRSMYSHFPIHFHLHASCISIYSHFYSVPDKKMVVDSHFCSFPSIHASCVFFLAEKMSEEMPQRRLNLTNFNQIGYLAISLLWQYNQKLYIYNQPNQTKIHVLFVMCSKPVQKLMHKVVLHSIIKKFMPYSSN